MGAQVNDPGPAPLSRSGAMDTLAGQRRQWGKDPCSGKSPCCFARTGSGRDGNGNPLMPWRVVGLLYLILHLKGLFLSAVGGLGLEGN